MSVTKEMQPSADSTNNITLQEEAKQNLKQTHT